MDITQEYLDNLQPMEESISKEIGRLEEVFRINGLELGTFQAFAIILSEKNKLTADRMKELAELKQELYQLKSEAKIADSKLITGQTPENNIKLLDRSGNII